MKHAKKLFLVQNIPHENNYRILLRNFQTQMHNIHMDKNLNLNEKLDEYKKQRMKFEMDKQKINNNEIVEVETKFENPLFKLVDPPRGIQNIDYRTDSAVNKNTERSEQRSPPPALAFGLTESKTPPRSGGVFDSLIEENVSGEKNRNNNIVDTNNSIINIYSKKSTNKGVKRLAHKPFNIDRSPKSDDDNTSINQIENVNNNDFENKEISKTDDKIKILKPKIKTNIKRLQRNNFDVDPPVVVKANINSGIDEQNKTKSEIRRNLFTLMNDDEKNNKRKQENDCDITESVTKKKKLQLSEERNKEKVKRKNNTQITTSVPIKQRKLNPKTLSSSSSLKRPVSEDEIDEIRKTYPKRSRIAWSPYNFANIT